MVTLQRKGYLRVSSTLGFTNVRIEGILFYFMIKKVLSLLALIIFIVCH